MSKDHCEECDDLGCSISDQKELSGLREHIFKLRYALNDRETWADCAVRVAGAISSVEKNGQRIQVDADFYGMLEAQQFIPGGRILRNAGKNKGMLLNCFGLGWEDNIQSIMQLVSDAVVISKYGGGIGFDASPLRPSGAPLVTQGNNSESSGMISFIDGVNSFLELIRGGGDRRAAGITFLSPSHPQIFEFINKKKTDDVWNNFNISVKLTQEFINAVKKDKPWNLQFNNKVYKTVQAREIWDAAVKHAWKKGDPGFVNFDVLEANNPLYYCEKIATVNPCISGDSLISTTMGELPIKELTKYKYVDVYTRNTNGQLTIRPATFFRTKTNAKIITVKTSRGNIKCTPDHKFITQEGKIEAKDLKPKQKIIGLLKKKGNERSVQVGITGGGYDNEARLVASYYFGFNTNLLYDVHHIDGNQRNNSIINLQLLPHYMHSIISNNGHSQWNETNKKGQYVKKQVKKKRKHVDSFGDCRTWRVLEIIDNGEREHVFDGTVDDTHCYFANGILISNCGEIPLPEYGACCLGSVNLSEMYDPKSNDVNWKLLKQVVYLAVRFLDNVLDVTEYPLPQIDLVARSTRRIGLGVMGLHYLMLKIGIKDYGSKDSIEFMEGLLTKFRNYAYEASIELAKERGAFEKFEAGPHLDGAFARTLPRRIRKDIEQYGLRNGTLLSMPPTGTTSVVAGVSQGIEPIFCPIYKRKYNEGGKKKQVTEMDALFKQFILEGKNVSHFIGAYDIPPEKHLEIQASAQQYMDNAISKTVLIEKDYQVEKLSKILLDHVQDVKGVTVYREGSKGEEILTPCDYKLPKDKLKKLAASV